MHDDVNVKVSITLSIWRLNDIDKYEKFMRLSTVLSRTEVVNQFNDIMSYHVK